MSHIYEEEGKCIMTAILPHGGTLVDKIITGPKQKALLVYCRGFVSYPCKLMDHF